MSTAWFPTIVTVILRTAPGLALLPGSPVELALPGPYAAQGDDAYLYAMHTVEVVERSTRLVQVLAVSLATLFIVVSGVRWMVAGGEPGEIDKAKRGIYGACIGYLIALVGEVLLMALDYAVKYEQGL